VAVAHSVHVGVNASRLAVAYGVPALTGAENDARAMAQIASAKGVDQPLLLTGNNAKVENVRVSIEEAIGRLSDGDFLIFSFAGHGLNAGHGGANDEKIDQSLVLSDALLCDDCLSDLLSGAPNTARLLLVFDCCSADGMAALLEQTFVTRSLSAELENRRLPAPEVEVSRACAGCEASDVQASTLILAACARDLETGERDGHGCFTAGIVHAMESGAAANYEALCRSVTGYLRQQRMPAPVFRFYGNREDPRFWEAGPFTGI
jgi:metacaspase-1